jgi:glycosyltransferase involved in cell wall biosynthesis
MHVLAFTTVFPSPARPLLGLFVWERLRHAASHASVTVVAPVAFRYRLALRQVQREGVTVHHPRFVYVPGLLKCLDGFFLALSALRTVRAVHRRFPVDLIDAHFGYPDGVAAVCLGRLLRRPVVITLRGSEAVTVTFRWRRAVMGWALRRAAAVIAVSAPLAELAMSLGVQAGRVHVIANGVDLERFRPGDREQARRELGLPQGPRLLLSVGHLVPPKGFHRVIGVLPALLDEFDVEYVVVGGDAPGAEGYRGTLRRVAREAGVGDRVHLVGAEPPERVAGYLRAADALVLDSDREGCPNVVWEAMASGRPVVAASVGAVGEMVDEAAGIVYSRRDPRDTAQLSDALRRALRRSWDAAAVRRGVDGRSWGAVGEAVAGRWIQIAPRPDSPVISTTSGSGTASEHQ